MTRARAACVAACLCLLAAGSSPCLAQTIVNGDFSTPVPSNGSGGGWTSALIDGAGGHRTTGGNPAGYFILNHIGQVGNDPTLTQTITGLSIGQMYRVTGDYKNQIIIGATANQAFGVAIDGVFKFESPGLADRNWRSFSFDFMAANTSAVLLLAAERNATDRDFAVDNISLGLTPGSTSEQMPEPAGWVLLLGAAPIAVLSLRRATSRV